MLWKRLFLSALLGAACFGSPVIEKVEPPNWWARHTVNPVQVLLTGRDLTAAKVTGPPGVRAEVRRISQNGHYAFVYLHLPAHLKPGEYSYRVGNGSGTTRFTLPLLAPEPPAGRAQGFTSSDVIYLLIPDRFDNGDPRNDALAESGPPADRDNPRYYHGGDFAGIERRLPYLKDLGVTGIWMLPVYKNSWRGKPPGFFYGYEAADYYDTDPRYGSMDDLKRLVRKAHLLGIKVMQDQVANHCGPGHYWVNDPPTPTWFNGLDRMPRLQNNFEIGAIANPYERPERRQNPVRGWFLGALPDLNQDDPFVSDYLVQNTLWWIAMSGVDGIRQDTYPYVDRPFWERWQTAVNREFPKLFVTGEITAATPAVLSFFDGGRRRAGVDTKLRSMLDFPLQATIRNVFAKHEPMTRLTELLAQDSLYRRPDDLVTFLGNHDIVRFLGPAEGSVRRLMLAQTFLLTTRGIPQLYYGDEVAMGSGDSSKSNTQSKDFPSSAFDDEGRTGDTRTVFDHVRSLLHFRKAHPALRGGRLINLSADSDSYAYLRSSANEHVLVLLNRGGSKRFDLDVKDLDLPEGMSFRSWASEQRVMVTNGVIAIPAAGEIEIFWANR